MACENHPTYGGKRTPRSGCTSCWDFYNERKGIHSVEGKPVGIILKPAKGNKVELQDGNFNLHISAEFPCEDLKEAHEFVDGLCVKCLRKEK